MEWFLFFLGIPAALVTQYVYDQAKDIIKKAKQKLAIKGVWAEFIKDSNGRQYSAGRIWFDKRRGFWAFDGTNYLNSGEPYCHWETVSSYVDVADRKYFYTFVARLENELNRSYYGFGVINLFVNDRDKLVPADGHYVSADIDGRPMSHSMVLTNLKYERSAHGNSFIDLISKNQK